MTTETALSPLEAVTVAQALTDAASLERFVNELPAEKVPVFLAKLIDGATNIRALTKGLEQRLAADGKTGAHFIVDGLEYAFFGALQKGYKDFPGLVHFLIEDCGLSPLAIAGAVSDARVTDLREAAAQIADEEKRKAALDEIEAHRVPKGERGAPKFQLVNEHMR